jgi:hypothetical protein
MQRDTLGVELNVLPFETREIVRSKGPPPSHEQHGHIARRKDLSLPRREARARARIVPHVLHEREKRL